MAEYTRRERTRTMVEFAIPAQLPYGAAWVELTKAIRAAHSELWDAGQVERERDAPDDAILILPGDDEIVVYYTREELS
jgi:hypothetical protein